MKNRIFVVLFFVLVIVSESFSQKMYTDYFNEAIERYQSGDLMGALSSFKYVVNYKPKNIVYIEALYFSGLINMKLNYPQTAISFYKKTIETSFDSAYLKGQESPYSILSHYRQLSSEELSETFYSVSKYDSALIYIYLADTVYKIGEEDFNGVEESHARHGIKIARIYEKSGQQDKAIDRLLKAVFYVFGRPDESIAELIRILQKEYTVSELKEITDKSFESIELYNGKRYCINFLGRRLDITYQLCDYRDSPCFDLSIPEQKKKAVSIIKKTKFYLIISGLK